MVSKVNRVEILKRIYREYDKDQDMACLVGTYGCFIGLLLLILIPMITGFIFIKYEVDFVIYCYGFLIDSVIILTVFFLYYSYRMYRKEKVPEEIEITVIIIYTLIVFCFIVFVIGICGYFTNIYIFKMNNSNIGFSLIIGFVESLIIMVGLFICFSILYCKGYYKKTKQILIEEGLTLSQ